MDVAMTSTGAGRNQALLGGISRGCSTPATFSETIHQLLQMRGHLTSIRIQLSAKPFTNFLAERHAMDAAYMTIAFGLGMRHDVSDWR